MDDELLHTWNRVAAGDLDGIDVRKIQRKLIYVCFDKAGDPDPEERLKALKVAAQFTVDDRMRLVDPMIRDADPRVRRYAFNLAVEARQAGLTALKTCVGGDDEELAVEALGLLITQADVTSSLHARQWLTSESPRIRAGAAMLLGQIAGPAMSVRLGRMAQNDPVYGVRVVAEEATRRCAGELPKATPRNFWEAGPTPIELPEPPKPTRSPMSTPTPVPAPPKRLVPPPPSAREPLAANAPTLHPPQPRERVPVPPPPTPTALTPAPPAADDPPGERPTRDWRDPSPLPSPLPTEAGALIKLMGMVGEGDRDAVRAAFEALSDRERTTALRSWSPGDDPRKGRGVALMLGALGDKRSGSTLRRMLADPDPGVRAGAAEAVGEVGALAMIPPLTEALRDGDPAVRAAAIRGLARLLVRTERPSMLRERIGPLTDDPDPQVKAAAQQALASIP